MAEEIKTVEETAEASREEGVGQPEISGEELQALYDQSLRNFREGEVVRGRVVEITDDFVVLDIGYKSEGAIPVEEFGSRDEVRVGQEFDVFIEQPEDDEGMPVISKIKADRIKNWTHVQQVYEKDGVIRGRIVRRVKGGFKVDVGVDAFMPASQLTWRPTSDLDQYVGQEMDVKIIKLTRRRRNVVVSRRKLLEEQRAGEKERLLSTIAPGQIIRGEVKNITDFGAFVDVGGIDGLLHVTDMSWSRVKHPSQVVSVGDRIDVVVLSFDPHTERISLGLKQKTENPWKTAAERYAIGDITRGRVVSMTDYGAFVQLEDGIEGMVHISEMSWTRRVRHPSEVLSLDEEVDVMVLNVEPEAEKIALGIKQTRPNPWRELQQRYPANSVVKGVVRNLTDYGAFVEIEEGLDALLHVSDLSWSRKINHPSEMLRKGQEIEVKILSIDPEAEKISIGLKQLEEDPWQKLVETIPLGASMEVEVSKLVSFGAFARLAEGVEGLIHVSELSEERVLKPEEVLSVGQKVMVKVISVEPSERKIGLSIREYQRDLHKEAEAAAASAGAVSIGDIVGDAMPASFLEGGQDPGQMAERMMVELSHDNSLETAGDGSSETPLETSASEDQETSA